MKSQMLYYAIATVLITNAGFAMPPAPQLYDDIQAGLVTSQYYLDNLSELRSRGVNSTGSLDFRGARGTLDVDFNALAILIQFTDQPNGSSAATFDELLFGDNPGTLSRYYSEVTYGNLTIVTINLPSSLGWSIAPQPYSYYANGQQGMGAYPNNAQKLVEEAVAAVNPIVNFADYDNNGDSFVDALFVVHSGPGAEITGNNNDIWSHQWHTSFPQLVDGVNVTEYTIEPEYLHSPNDMTCGVFCHEMGHSVFDLPDLYDIDGSSRGLGKWSLMASGSWNGEVLGSSPAHPDPWCRIRMGIVTPTVITSNVLGQTIPQSEYYPTIFKLWNSNLPSTEYFLVENRQQVGFDVGLPASGVLVYHIDETRDRNRLEWYPGHTSFGNYQVAIEQADGLWELEQNFGLGDDGDPYPGVTNNRVFDDVSLPNSASYELLSTSIAIRSISNSSAVMSADFFVVESPIQVLAPNNGELLTRGQPFEIRWSGNVGNVMIHLYEGGITPPFFLRTIAANEPNDGSLIWTVDCDLVAATGYYIGIAEMDNSPSDFSDQSFTIGGASLPLVTGVAATDNSCSDVVVSWSDVLWDDLQFYRVLRNGAVIADNLWQSQTSYSDQIVDPGVYYNYAVQARTFQCFGEQSLADPGRRYPGPAAPSNCAASESDCNGILITWTDNSDNETGFYLKKDDSPFGWAVVGPNVTSYYDAGAVGMHQYTVRAYNQCDNSGDSNTDQGAPAQPPPQVQELSASTTLPDLTITWQDVAGESGYVVLRNGNELSGILPVNTTSYVDPWAYPEIYYLYQVRSVNGNCPTLLSNSVIGYRTAPGGCEISPDTTWTRTWDIALDIGRTAVELDYGGLLVVGTTELISTGETRVGIVHTDANGDPWFVHYYWSGQLDDEAYSLKRTSQGLAVAGKSRTSNLNDQMLLLITDNSGFPQTHYNFGGAGNESAYDVSSSGTDGYILVGSTSAPGSQNLDYNILKTTSNGTIVANRVLGTSGNDVAFSVDRTTDSGYVVCGYTTFNGQEDIWLIKLNSACDSLWSRRYGGPANERGKSVEQLPDDGYLIFGSTNSFGFGGDDYYLIRTNSSGDTVWSRTFGGPYDDIAYAMERAPNGNILMAGSTQSYSSCRTDMLNVITDDNGNLLSLNEYGDNGDQLAFGCTVLSDGRFLLIGTSDSADFYGVKSALNWGGFAAPEITITLFNNDIMLNWSNTAAPYYRIYSAQTSEGPFVDLEGSTSDTIFVHYGALNSSAMRFYVVKSSSQP